MSNVVSMRKVSRWADEPALPQLIDMFASRRRGRHDAYWMKENAELVQILAALGIKPSEADMEPLSARAEGLMDELRFFPQYYRMFLSLGVDLRALGVTEAPVEEMAEFVLRNRLIEGETSDTHRNEAMLLLRRSGCRLRDTAIESRLHEFTVRPRGFCLPNRRAAYDLTHIVFHAADYGRQPLARDPARRISLIHAGMVAWLEDNLDLLAEVSIALRLSGEEVPQVWQATIARAANEVRFEPGSAGGAFDDDYHQYLVLNWASALVGQEPFKTPVPASARIVRQPARDASALQELSLALLDMGRDRRPVWAMARWRLLSKLSESSRARLAVLEEMPEFDGFYAGFSRCDRIEGGL